METNFLNKIKDYATAGVAFGKKNAPQLMTGGGVILGWFAAYLFWKESRKAEAAIANEEAKLRDQIDILNENSDDEECPQKPSECAVSLPTKDKVIIYLQYCWLSLVLGVASTGLCVGAQKLSMDRLAEMYLLTQFLGDKNEKQEKLITKLKEKAGIKDDGKEMTQIKSDLIDDKHDPDEVKEYLEKYSKDHVGKTLFIDEVTGARFWNNIVDVTDGINEFLNSMKEAHKDAINKKVGDSFYAKSEMPWDDFDLYSAKDLGVFLDHIGEHDTDRLGLADLLEFRYYGRGELFKPKDILNYKQYMDPETGMPVVCYIDYEEYLSPSSELMERNPI